MKFSTRFKITESFEFKRFLWKPASVSKKKMINICYWAQYVSRLPTLHFEELHTVYSWLWGVCCTWDLVFLHPPFPEIAASLFSIVHFFQAHFLYFMKHPNNVKVNFKILCKNIQKRSYSYLPSDGFLRCRLMPPSKSTIRVSFCTRHMPNDSQSQPTFAASQSKDMLKYDQRVKKPMM